VKFKLLTAIAIKFTSKNILIEPKRFNQEPIDIPY
jgi:hypothetical protein